MTGFGNQAGYPTITLSADYSTRPLDDRWYYDARVGYWKDDENGWLLEFLHHKVTWTTLRRESTASKSHTVTTW